MIRLTWDDQLGHPGYPGSLPGLTAIYHPQRTGRRYRKKGRDVEMPGLATLPDGASGLLQIPALAVIVFILVYAGVVLPAVWSARAARRAAAAAVLQQILDLLRRSR